MLTRIIILASCSIAALTSRAQTETSDSIKAKELNEVVVEAQMQRTSATTSTYIPLMT